MFIDLIRKEFIFSRLGDKNRPLLNKVLEALLKAIGVGLFIALEVFIYISLNEQVNEYSTNGSFDFLVLVIFITMLISIIFTTLKARKVLFNKDDFNILSTLPISNSEILLSKIAYLYLYQVIINLCITSPILIAYFALKVSVPTLYVFSLFFSIIISLFGIGISLIFSIVFEYIYKFIKLFNLVQFILAVIFVVLLCFLYQVVLDIFLTGLSNTEGTGMFSSALIDGVHRLVLYLIPVYTILNPLINLNNVLSGVCLTLGFIILSLLLGFIVASLSYNFVRLKMNDDFYIKKKSNKEIMMLPKFKALLKKEFILLFKDSSNIFSYTALLIMTPFLSFVVITSLNQIIYQNLAIFSIYFPELINGLNILLILLFSAVINASASSSISRENKAVQIVKYLPIDPYKQVLAKLIPPIVLSTLSLLVTNVVLIATNNIDYKVFLVSTFIDILLIIFTSIFGLYADMYDKGKHQHKISYINTIVSIGFPLLILVIHFALSFSRASGYGIYLLESILAIALIVPLFINFKKKWLKVFEVMEVN